MTKQQHKATTNNNLTNTKIAQTSNSEAIKSNIQLHKPQGEQLHKPHDQMFKIHKHSQTTKYGFTKLRNNAKVRKKKL